MLLQRGRKARLHTRETGRTPRVRPFSRRRLPGFGHRRDSGSQPGAGRRGGSWIGLAGTLSRELERSGITRSGRIMNGRLHAAVRSIGVRSRSDTLQSGHRRDVDSRRWWGSVGGHGSVRVRMAVSRAHGSYDHVLTWRQSNMLKVISAQIKTLLRRARPPVISLLAQEIPWVRILPPIHTVAL